MAPPNPSVKSPIKVQRRVKREVELLDPGGTGNPKDAPPLMVAHTMWNQDATVLSRYLDSLFIEGGQTNL